MGFAVWMVAWVRSDIAQRIPKWLNVALLAITAAMVFSSLQVCPTCGSHGGRSAELCRWHYARRGDQRLRVAGAGTNTTWFTLSSSGRHDRARDCVCSLVQPRQQLSRENIVSVVFTAYVGRDNRLWTSARLRLSANASRNAERTEQCSARSYTLGDLFIFAAVAALMLVVARPIVVIAMPELDVWRRIVWAAFAPAATIMLGVQSGPSSAVRNGLRACDDNLWCAGCRGPFQFSTGRVLWADRGETVSNWFRVTSTALISSFVVYLIYRTASKAEFQAATDET